jgi:hypothetical protein
MTLTIVIDGKRHVFAAFVPDGKDPGEMTLGEWKAAPAYSAVALFNDFLASRPVPAQEMEK